VAWGSEKEGRENPRRGRRRGLHSWEKGHICPKKKGGKARGKEKRVDDAYNQKKKLKRSTSGCGSSERKKKKGESKKGEGKRSSSATERERKTSGQFRKVRPSRGKKKEKGRRKEEKKKGNRYPTPRKKRKCAVRFSAEEKKGAAGVARLKKKKKVGKEEGVRRKASCSPEKWSALSEDARVSLSKRKEKGRKKAMPFADADARGERGVATSRGKKKSFCTLLPKEKGSKKRKDPRFAPGRKRSRLSIEKKKASPRKRKGIERGGGKGFYLGGRKWVAGRRKKKRGETLAPIWDGKEEYKKRKKRKRHLLPGEEEKRRPC